MRFLLLIFRFKSLEDPFVETPNNCLHLEYLTVNEIQSQYAQLHFTFLFKEDFRLYLPVGVG